MGHILGLGSTITFMALIQAAVIFEGGSAEFSAGDYVIFPKGLKCTWKVAEDITKHYKFG